jgi:hypothetical protein
LQITIYKGAFLLSAPQRTLRQQKKQKDIGNIKNAANIFFHKIYQNQ